MNPVEMRLISRISGTFWPSKVEAVKEGRNMKCSNCQRENDPTYRFCIFCGSSLPASEAQGRSEVAEDSPVDDTSLDIADSSQKNVTRHQMEAVTNYMGFRRRLVAWIIDAVILGAIFPIIVLITYFVYYETSSGRYLEGESLGAGIFYWLCFGIIYFIGFWSWRGQTPGKIVMKIKIVRSDGSPLGIGRAILRYICFLLSTLIAFIGHFMIIWDSKKQGLHDKIARTCVINTHQVRALESLDNKMVAHGL